MTYRQRLGVCSTQSLETSFHVIVVPSMSRIGNPVRSSINLRMGMSSCSNDDKDDNADKDDDKGKNEGDDEDRALFSLVNERKEGDAGAYERCAVDKGGAGAYELDTGAYKGDTGAYELDTGAYEGDGGANT
jgi:hypothetical protein